MPNIKITDLEKIDTPFILNISKMTSMDEDLNGRRPQWKTTSLESNLNGRRPQWKTTSMEDNLNIRRP